MGRSRTALGLRDGEAPTDSEPLAFGPLLSDICFVVELVKGGDAPLAQALTGEQRN